MQIGSAVSCRECVREQDYISHRGGKEIPDPVKPSSWPSCAAIKRAYCTSVAIRRDVCRMHRCGSMQGARAHRPWSGAIPWSCSKHMLLHGHRSRTMMYPSNWRQHHVKNSLVQCCAASNGQPSKAAHMHCFKTQQGHQVSRQSRWLNDDCLMSVLSHLHCDAAMQVHTRVDRHGSTFVVSIDVEGELAQSGRQLALSWCAMFELRWQVH